MPNIVCYCKNGEPLEFLTQWDHDVVMVVEGLKNQPIPTFRYSNRISKTAKCVTPTLSDGKLYAIIPNVLLQSHFHITVLVSYAYDTGEEKVEYRFNLPVFPAVKPDDYVCEQDEVRTWSDLDRRISAIESGESIPGFESTMHSITLVAEDQDYGVIINPEGTSDAPVVALYGEHNNGQVIVRNLRTPEQGDDAANKDYVDNALSRMWDDLHYNPIKVNTVSLTPNVAMLGSVVSNPRLVWTLSREAVAQWVDGGEIPAGDRTMVVERDFTATANSVTVTARDERDAEHSATARIAFHNAVYYGKQVGREMPTDLDLQAMPYKLQSGMGLTINAAAGADEYILYACPSRLGTPEFWCNGFQGGFEKCSDPFLHTNAEGYTEEYDVWLSNAAGLTGVTITVK